MRIIRTLEDRAAELADIEARFAAGQITKREAKRRRHLVDVAYEAYRASAMKSAFMGGRSAS